MKKIIMIIKPPVVTIDPMKTVQWRCAYRHEWLDDLRSRTNGRGLQICAYLGMSAIFSQEKRARKPRRKNPPKGGL